LPVDPKDQWRHKKRKKSKMIKAESRRRSDSHLAKTMLLASFDTASDGKNIYISQTTKPHGKKPKQGKGKTPEESVTRALRKTSCQTWKN